MNVLVCNAGSTSLKFRLIEMPAEEEKVQCKIQRIGSAADSVFTYIKTGTGEKIHKEKVEIPDYACGIEMFLDELLRGPLSVLEREDQIERVGFKTVLSKDHYGDHELDEEALEGLRYFLPIAPAHNAPYLQAIETMKKYFKTQLFVGAFETAFNESIPLYRKLYGVPYEWYEKYGVRKYGYHGASHSYVASVIEKETKEYKAVSCHLGGSGSMCAIVNGKSVDNSFGMSLQTGIMHCYRVGDIDWAMPDYLKQCGLTEKEIQEGMNKKGGFLGISGFSDDCKYVEEAAQSADHPAKERAQLALDVYANGIIRYVGAYIAEMNGIDYLAFTGGIGEHSSIVRGIVCDHLEYLGLKYDKKANENHEACISTKDSKVKVLVIPANEEIVVARRTYAYKK